jgi:signal transduction histidine kinase/ActR/RegA family two-component response regulator
VKTSTPIASRAVFAWTAVLTILLASFAFVTLLTNSKSETIKTNIQALQLENDNHRKIDTCISLLYSAENNSRFFVVTLDSAYIRSYSTQLKTVIQILDQYETEKESRAKSLSRLISNKQQKNEEFINLRMMVDSLLSFSLHNPETLTIAPGKRMRKVSATSQAEQKDSIEISSKKSKRNLVKRIMDAIRDKDPAEKKVSNTRSSTVVRQDSVNLAMQQMQMKNYALLEKARHELSTTEQQLLAINGRIFANLQKSLRELKSSEERDVKTLRNSLLAATKSKFDEMNLLIWGSVLLVSLLAVMIIWNLVKLYKKDVTIIQYANITAETTKRKGDFMAQMTHEIRTPLNSIIGFSQLIDTRKLDEELRVNVNSIKTASRILLTLVNEILDFSKFESGKITLLNKPFYPHLLLNESVSMLSVLANEKHIAVSTNLDMDADITLNGDDVRIKQVVINLLTNAIKFTPENGTIKVSAHFEKINYDKGLFKINVKDSGVGIAKEHLGAIFEDFIQVESGENEARQIGTGLGLAICKRIVNLYNGNIKVESTVGEGSEFMVSIPLKIVANTSKTSPSENVTETLDTKDPAKLLQGKKVLIADDTKMNLILISRFMDKLGATYDLTDDGKMAFEMFNNHLYDLVITDIYMPEMDGLELTKLIRTHQTKEKSHVPILGFTGSTEDNNVAHYLQIGMNDVLPKPFEEAHLADVVKKLLHGKN